MPYDKWISLDEKAREDLMVAVAAVKKKATRLVKKNERECHYAAAANMTLEEWRNLSKDDKAEQKKKSMHRMRLCGRWKKKEGNLWRKPKG